MTLQSLSVITLGVADLDACRRFYGDGFGWTPVFENEEILFYQMNGFVLGLWLSDRLADDMARQPAPSGSTSLAHNVREQAEVEPLMARLAAHGGSVLALQMLPFTADSAAMSPIRTDTRGKSRTTRRGRSTTMGTSAFAPVKRLSAALCAVWRAS